MNNENKPALSVDEAPLYSSIRKIHSYHPSGASQTRHRLLIRLIIWIIYKLIAWLG
jgi:hypothetical protein